MSAPGCPECIAREARDRAEFQAIKAECDRLRADEERTRRFTNWWGRLLATWAGLIIGSHYLCEAFSGTYGAPLGTVAVIFGMLLVESGLGLLLRWDRESAARPVWPRRS